MAGYAAPLEGPAYETLERLKNLFPSASETELEEIIQVNGSDIDVCASALLEQGAEMSGNLDETETEGAVGGAVITALPYEDGNDAKGPEDEEEDLYKLVVPAEFGRTLLSAFGHPEDENRVPNLDQRTVKIGGDTAFEIYKGLYVNMHMGNGGASSNASNSPTCSSVDDEFDAIAVSLGQMDLETFSEYPPLPTSTMDNDNDSRLHRDTTKAQASSLIENSASYRTTAQIVNLGILKQQYPHLEPGDIDEVYVQCELNIDRTKSALNEIYPSPRIPSSTQIGDKPSLTMMTNEEASTVRYNPKDVSMYTPEQLQELRTAFETLDREWQAKMSKYRHYHDKAKETSDRKIKANYIREAMTLKAEMKNLEDDKQYYLAVQLNAQHNNDNLLDLHGLRVDGAMRVLEEFLQCKEQEFAVTGARTRKMIPFIITGQGIHSRNGEPVLKPAVRNFLYHRGYKFHTTTPGTYSVVLTRRTVPSSSSLK